MKHEQRALQLLLWFIIPLSLGLFLVTVSSCKGKITNGSSFHFNYDSTKTKFDNSNCITLTRSQINAEWATEFTDPKNPAAEKIYVIKFFTEVSPAQNSFVVKAMAYNSSNDPLGKEIVLGDGQNCGRNLPPYFRGLSNEFLFSTLGIIVPETGKLKDDFKQLILDPFVTDIGGNNFLAYTVYTDEGTFPQEKGDSYPCPPCINCKLCPKICDNKCDTAVSQ